MPAFWLLAQFDILFPETGTQVPASMHLGCWRDARGGPSQQWDRTFAFARERRFNAVMRYDDRQGCTVERMGPAGLLEMAWGLTFAPPNTVTITTSTCRLIAGRLRIPLPPLLYPRVTAIETALPDGTPSTIHIDLLVAHPRLGDVFGYEGTFHLKRVPR